MTVSTASHKMSVWVAKGVFINTLVGGLGKMEGGQKSLELQKGGDQKVFRSKRGGQKSLVKLKV